MLTLDPIVASCFPKKTSPRLALTPTTSRTKLYNAFVLPRYCVVGESVAAQKLSRTSRVSLTAAPADASRHLAMAATGLPAEEGASVSASRRTELVCAKASSQRGARSTEVVCSRRRQMVERTLEARVARASEERKGEKEEVREVRIVGSNEARKVNSR